MAEFINTVDVIGDDALTDSIIDRSITEYKDDSLTKIGTHALRNCQKLASVDFPAVTMLDTSAFDFCLNLESVHLPALTSVGTFAFNYCRKLISVDFPALTRIDYSAFSSCTTLTALILRGNTVCTLVNASAFPSTPIASGTGYIYVPRDLVDSYKTAMNWSNYASQFRALEDYTVDGTTTGELDPNLI